jgi:hypothetical protein
MKHPILPCLLFVCANTFAANKSVAPQDTTHLQGQPWEISEIAFLEQYGKDDTSRALIDYYFYKQRVGKRTTLYSAGIITASGVIASLIIVAGKTSTPYLAGAGLLFIIIMEAGIIAFIVGFFSWISHARHKLFQLLANYRRENSISKGIKRNYIFKRFLAMEQSNKSH